ncbi:unnamed protein product [Darwinula stevensoni]|uniref:Queuosine 5'-phosphate N-glycosylase/hydrolase n=1 Tax=Darwinula stevensoni TaxID=69355 RepID=A0A7R9FPK9_9CRUS|nr:unnamed protein product [Darwinula stevensoni]CAG0897735.1 unnamed protein product [Darwinula stevensoni]
MALGPRESGEWIAKQAEHVKINPEAVRRLATRLAADYKDGKFTDNYDQWEPHPKTRDKSTLEWIFWVSTLNFSFWTEPGEAKYLVTHKGQKWSGYFSLCAALNRALDQGIPLLDPAFYSTLTLQQVKDIFKSDSGMEIPLVEERHQVITEAGLCSFSF